MSPPTLTSLFALLVAALGLGLGSPRGVAEGAERDVASQIGRCAGDHAAAIGVVHHDTLSRARATASPALEGVAPVFTFGAPIQWTGHTPARGAHPLLACGAVFAAHATRAQRALAAAPEARRWDHAPPWRAPGHLRVGGDDDEPS